MRNKLFFIGRCQARRLPEIFKILKIITGGTVSVPWSFYNEFRTGGKEVISMTILPWKKICPVCGKEYDFNPDAGKMFCPRCKEKMGNCPEVALRVPVDLKTPIQKEKEE